MFNTEPVLPFYPSIYEPPSEFVSPGDWWDWHDGVNGPYVPVHTGRLSQELRDAARRPAIANLVASLVERLRASRLLPGASIQRSHALADLAITGRTAFFQFRRMVIGTPPIEDVIVDVARAARDVRDLAVPEDEVRDAARRTLYRAFSVAWSLIGPTAARAQLRRSQGWIAVSAEEAQPHAPVNVYCTPDPMGVLLVPVDGKLQELRASISLDSTLYRDDSTPPTGGELFRLPTGDEQFQEILRDGRGVLFEDLALFIHGLGSQLEEGPAFKQRLIAEAREHGRRLAILSLDLPGFGYSPLDIDGMLRLRNGGHHGTFDQEDPRASRFPLIDYYVDVLVAVASAIPGHIQYVVGGSLGANVTLWLAERGLRSVRRSYAWSPPSMWTSYERAHTNEFNEPKRQAFDEVKDRVLESNNDERRYQFFEMLQRGERALNIGEGFFYGWLLSPVFGLPGESLASVFGGVGATTGIHTSAWGNPSSRTALLTRAEQYSWSWRRMLWLAAWTQMAFSHREGLLSDGLWPFRAVDHPVLVASGSADNGEPGGILVYYDALKEVTEHAVEVPGERLLAIGLGHSMHDENPGFMAWWGAEFFFRRPLGDERAPGVGLYVGDVVALHHRNTGVRLHARDVLYDHEGSSRQNQVVGFATDHPDNRWVVLPPHDQREVDFEGRLGHGSVVRLMHLNTGRNLHSHARIPSPLSNQQEVSSFGSRGTGDTNDDWQLKFPEADGSDRRGFGAPVVLKHVATNAALHSHPISGPTLDGHQEVTGYTGDDSNDRWELERNHVGLFFGDRIVLRHAETWARLASDAGHYDHEDSSRQQRVFALHHGVGSATFQGWILRPAHGEPDPGRLVRIENNSLVRLSHVATGSNLHSHLGLPSPMTRQQEVTCFGTSGEGDSNDTWRIEFVSTDGAAIGYRATIRLWHQNTAAALHSHRVRLAEFQEVTAFPEAHTNNLWVVEVYPSWRPDSVVLRTPDLRLIHLSGGRRFRAPT